MTNTSHVTRLCIGSDGLIDLQGEQETNSGTIGFFQLVVQQYNSKLILEEFGDNLGRESGNVFSWDVWPKGERFGRAARKRKSDPECAMIKYRYNLHLFHYHVKLGNNDESSPNIAKDLKKEAPLSIKDLCCL